MTALIIGVITIVALLGSRRKSKTKTAAALRQSLTMAKAMAPQLVPILLFVSLGLAFLDPATIRTLMGSENQVLNGLSGAAIGSVTIIPGVIAFPLASQLSTQGAGTAGVAAFITTLTMVGLATAPIEAKAFGKRFTVVRNLSSFAVAMVIAIIMGVIL